jgi:predicted Zn-dependent protease
MTGLVYVSIPFPSEDEAFEWYRVASALDPQHRQARVNLAVHLNDRGLFEEAIKELDEYLRLVEQQWVEQQQQQQGGVTEWREDSEVRTCTTKRWTL